MTAIDHRYLYKKIAESDKGIILLPQLAEKYQYLHKDRGGLKWAKWSRKDGAFIKDSIK